MDLRLGYFCNSSGDFNGFAKPYTQTLGEITEIAEYLDNNAWDDIWFAEHHFSHEGAECVPNPLLLSAYIAAKTQHIRIGQAANIATFWNPIRLAEDIAVVDQMSGGRLEVGLGRGIYGREALNINPAADTRNEEQNRQIFNESVEILRKSLSQEFFEHQGKIYQYPQPGLKWDHAMSAKSPEYMEMDTYEVQKLALVPRSLQQPHPPFWQVVDSPRSIKAAAEAGMGVMYWIPPTDALKPRFELYRDAAVASQGRPFDLGEGIAVVRDMFVADTLEEARELAGQGIIDYLKWVCHWRGLGNHAHLGETVTLQVKDLDFDFLNERNLLFGTPDMVAEKIQEMRDELNIQHLLVWSNFPGVPHDAVMRSIQLFTEQVMPRFKSSLQDSEFELSTAQAR